MTLDGVSTAPSEARNKKRSTPFALLTKPSTRPSSSHAIHTTRTASMLGVTAAARPLAAHRRRKGGPGEQVELDAQRHANQGWKFAGRLVMVLTTMVLSTNAGRHILMGPPLAGPRPRAHSPFWPPTRSISAFCPILSSTFKTVQLFLHMQDSDYSWLPNDYK